MSDKLKKRFSSFKKAYLLFSSMLANYEKDENNISNQLALIQSYEIVFELSWKVIKDYLEYNGVGALLPRDVIKEGSNEDYINSFEVWLDMLQSRNLCSHLYDEKIVLDILSKISDSFKNELEIFYKKIKDKVE